MMSLFILSFLLSCSQKDKDKNLINGTGIPTLDQIEGRYKQPAPPVLIERSQKKKTKENQTTNNDRVEDSNNLETLNSPTLPISEVDLESLYSFPRKSSYNYRSFINPDLYCERDMGKDLIPLSYYQNYFQRWAMQLNIFESDEDINILSGWSAFQTYNKWTGITGISEILYESFVVVKVLDRKSKIIAFEKEVPGEELLNLASLAEKAKKTPGFDGEKYRNENAKIVFKLFLDQDCEGLELTNKLGKHFECVRALSEISFPRMGLGKNPYLFNSKTTQCYLNSKLLKILETEFSAEL
ncbi:MAG: hypothetical protein H6620_01755 [Halobacteriovoraceae bacterium]|nr:hypothetical protein [Halobacteriovoraceae bacterium]